MSRSPTPRAEIAQPVEGPRTTDRPDAQSRPELGEGAPRVLVLITQNQRRGAETFACTLAGELSERHFGVRLLALSPATTTATLPVPALGSSPLAASTLWRLRREIAAADLVLACGSRTLPASVIAGAGVATPIIYQNIGDPLFWAGSPSRRLRVRALLARTAAVAALTEQSATVLQSHFGVAANRVQVIRNARDADTFRPATAAERIQSRRQLGLPDGVPVVAIVGALGPEKQVDAAISAVAQLAGDARLLVAGDGPLRASLEAQANAQAPGRVRFLGQRADLGPVYRACDAVVLTSASEGVPGVLIEAGLSGLPVVSTDVGFVRDIVVPGQTGYVVPLGDIGAITTGLEQAMADADGLGAAARQHCVERFDLARVVDDWAELIRVVLGEETKGNCR